jgi:hypothetical protein
MRYRFAPSLMNVQLASSVLTSKDSLRLSGKSVELAENNHKNNSTEDSNTKQ